jgi:putative ABC transport system permease protein
MSSLGPKNVEAHLHSSKQFAEVNMISLYRDAYLAARVLARSPRFAILMTMLLALGIASNTIIFSAVQSVFLRPLPYPEADRLVYVSQAYPGFPEGGGQFTYPTFKDIQQENSSFDTFAAYQVTGPLALTDHPEPVRVAVTYCTPSYLKLLGARASLGRIFQEQDDRVGSAEPLIVLTHGFWQRQFASSRTIIGQTIHLNNRPFVVVGVLPAAFRDSLYEQENGEEGDAFIPLGLAHSLTGYAGPADRVGSILWGIGHLKPGATVRDARNDLASLAKRFEQTYPDTFRGYGLVARSLKDQLLGQFYTPGWILAGASAFLLLIGCANVGNLLLARLLARQRELAVRSALGASPGRLARHLLIENALLIVLGGTLGLALAVRGMDALRFWAAAHLPTVMHLEGNRSALALSVLISLVTGLLFGVAPAIVGSRVDLREALSQSGRQGQSLARRKSQKILVVVEVALALVLLVAAGLLGESFRKLSATDLGFKTADLLTLRLDLRSARYAEPADRARFTRTVVDKFDALPGVQSATLWGPSMLGRATWVYIAYAEGNSPENADARLMMGRHSVNPGALANLQIPLLAGREFTWADATDKPAVAVISESVAKRMWPGQNAVGKRMRSAEGNFPWITVVGVARDARHGQRFDLTDAAAGIAPYGLKPQYDAYFPYIQRPNQGVTLAIRTSADIRAMSEEIKQAVVSLDPGLPVYDLALLDDRLAAQVAPVRAVAALSGAYAVAALLLAAFGLFAVLAHDVGQRTHEIGIRIALGAKPTNILGLIIREGIMLTLAGLVAGFFIATFATHAMQALLFGVSSTEPFVFVGISALLTIVAVVACYLPARRATRFDPIAALRQD